MSKLSLFLCAAFVAQGFVTAADPTPVQSAPASHTAAPSPVSESLKNCSYVTNARPAHNAKYYFVLYSASWCGPCRAEMPKLVKEYPALKEAGVEIIHISCDHSIEAAQEWAASENVPFPIIAPKQTPKFPVALPHCNGIPHMYLIDASGKLLSHNHPVLLMPQWRRLCK